MKKQKWVTIADDKVQHIWQCESDECNQGNPCEGIKPDWYQNNGTPTCGCGRDMVYVRTEISK